jgi:hypothetical protein
MTGNGSERRLRVHVSATDERVRSRGFPLQAIASGRYRDRFQRREREWRFAERIVSTSLVGDVSHHRREQAPALTPPASPR